MIASSSTGCGPRAGLRAIVESAALRRLVVAAILANAVALGLETLPPAQAWAARWLFWLDEACIVLFALEIAGRIAVGGWRFFLGGWNLFDFAVVAVSLAPAEHFVSILMSLRLLWVLRLVSTVPSLRLVVQALLDAVPAMASVSTLLLLLLYVAAVMGCDLFGARFPQWFGSVGASMFTMFQVLTLDAWSDSIARPVMAALPWAWVYFVVFIVLVTMAVLNLFVGVLVNSLQSTTRPPSVAEDVAALRREVAELKEMLRERVG